MLSKPLAIMSAAVLIAYNIASVGYAYRAGQASVQRQQLETFVGELQTAIDRHNVQLMRYDVLAAEFAANHERTQSQLKQTGDTLNAYLATIDRQKPCLESGAVSLLNQHIRPATQPAGIAPAAGRSERPAPLRRPAATQCRQPRRPHRLDQPCHHPIPRLPNPPCLCHRLD